VPEENVRLNNMGASNIEGQMLSQIAIRVSGSRLCTSQRHDALESNSLLREANDEMARADKPLPQAFPPSIQTPSETVKPQNLPNGNGDPAKLR